MPSPTRPSVDSEVFRRTASKTKVVNLGRVSFRGVLDFDLLSGCCY